MQCTTEKYNLLYTRYLEKPGALLDWVGYNPITHSLLDLCGGSGAVAEEAIRQGGKLVTLFDLNPRCQNPKVQCFSGDANRPESLRRMGISFDIIVCRQAINYLNLDLLSQSLYFLLNSNGRFVFNTFAKPKYFLRFYKYRGRIYFEASGYLRDRVFHCQATTSGLDISTFKWYSLQTYLLAFKDFVLQNRKVTEKSIWLNFQPLWHSPVIGISP